MNEFINFIRFSRLHTVIGTTLSLLALYLIAYGLSDGGVWRLDIFFWSWVSCMGANIYIVGLNQITDVEIDKINKPYLPLASGAFSMQTGRVIVGISLLLSLAIAFYLGRYLLLTVLVSLALGTAYSLPPIRLKRFHFWAAFCIIAIRGVVVNIFLFLHFQDWLSQAKTIPAVIWLLTGAIFLFSIVIAWFKDIPDIEGDRAYAIRTLTVRMGAKKVWQAGNALLITMFVVLASAPVLWSLSLNGLFFAGANLALLLALMVANRRVDLSDQSSIARYYQFIWLLFFGIYISFATAVLLG
jgi:homogentisate phytyltransferase/homogentisate geranylgeranyltransferase